MAELVSGFWTATAAGAAVGGPVGAAMTVAGAATRAVDLARTTSGAGGGGAGGAGAHFAVDPDRIPELVAELEQARKKLREAAELANDSKKIDPMGKDQFSPHAAERMGPRLVENYLAANKRQQDDIKRMIESLDAAKKSYENTDDANKAAFRKRS
ncbi:PE domain-containing protein [Streptoalloteichus hindustanus]|uniref:PE family protein n=1 Tax=Streptoalloteichus hindustanus TaxID=2017 RepID=A0A1M5KDL7_STRHI|nr:PE domain-containing protein [Streptoalloteichus hindustanus]SHG50857.1 PE family protein [Streptoalloteichus hindustanus]